MASLVDCDRLLTQLGVDGQCRASPKVFSSSIESTGNRVV